MHFPLSSIEANVRAFVSSVKVGSASANPTPVDEPLSSKRATKRSESRWPFLETGAKTRCLAPALVTVKLETTNCHSIELNDVI